MKFSELAVRTFYQQLCLWNYDLMISFVHYIAELLSNNDISHFSIEQIGLTLLFFSAEVFTWKRKDNIRFKSKRALRNKSNVNIIFFFFCYFYLQIYFSSLSVLTCLSVFGSMLTFVNFILIFFIVRMLWFVVFVHHSHTHVLFSCAIIIKTRYLQFHDFINFSSA